MGGDFKGNCRLISKKVILGIGESHIFINLIFVFSVVELTMRNLGLTPNGVCNLL